MPEPDFEQIAERLAQGMGAPPEAPAQLAEELRLIWNARGAADVDAFAQQVTDDGDRIELVESTGRAIRSLDR